MEKSKNKNRNIKRKAKWRSENQKLKNKNAKVPKNKNEITIWPPWASVLARSAYSIKYGKGGNKFGADFRIPETQMELNEIA